jgi:hypothetical protein
MLSVKTCLVLLSSFCDVARRHQAASLACSVFHVFAPEVHAPGGCSDRWDGSPSAPYTPVVAFNAQAGLRGPPAEVAWTRALALGADGLDPVSNSRKCRLASSLDVATWQL